MSVPFSAVLLAGGKSTRMGTDKCFLTLSATQGKPLWQHQLATLECLGAQEIFISARPEQNGFQPYPVITDLIPNAGPLGGIASALSQIQTSLLVVLGVDLPHLSAAMLQSLLAASTNERGAIFRGPEFYEPLAAVYPKAMLPSALARLTAGNFRLQTWVQQAVEFGQMTAMPIPAEARSAFRNLNTPSDCGPDSGI
jgi:molybdopterin-guanine dinucleotide biosynthesis protein A